MGQAKYGSIEINIFPSCKIRMKACSQFQQRCQLAIRFDRSFVGINDLGH